MFSLTFMNMQMRYNLHTCVLPLDDNYVSKPHIGSLNERTCQIVSLVIYKHATMIVWARNMFYVFMIFLILRFSLIFMAIQIRYMKQFDLAPPSSLARAEASFGRVHLTAHGGFESYSKRNKMIMVMMIYSL